MWEQQVGIIVGGSVVLTLVAFLSRSIVKHLLDRDLAAHKAKLEATHEVQLERTKADLQKSVIEHEIRYRNIHEKVAETIGKTFARLLELHKAVGAYVAIVEIGPEPSKETKLEAVHDANQRFNDYFFPRQIYLPPHLCEKVSTLYAKLYSITNQFTFGYQREKSGRAPPGSKYWDESFDSFQEEARPLFDELRMEFHAMLRGVPAEQELRTDSGLNRGDSPSEARGMGNAT